MANAIQSAIEFKPELSTVYVRSTCFLAAAIMGLSTAMVYPTFLAAMSDLAHRDWRASALGVYRLWQDSGYAFGALLGGVLSDIFTMQIAGLMIAILTVFSGGVTALFLPETVRLSDAFQRLAPLNNKSKCEYFT